MRITYKFWSGILILSFILIIFSGSFDRAETKSSHLSGIYNSLYQRNYPDVINQAEKLKAAYPNDNTLYFLQGYAYFKTNNLALAIQCFSKAISLNRNKGDVHFLRAEMYQRSGRYKEALDDMNWAIRDKNTPVQMVELYKLIGYKNHIEFFPPTMYFFRATTNSSLGLYKASMDDINQAIALAPGPAPNYLRLRGFLYFIEDQYALAYDDYQKAVTLNPKIRGAWGPLGQLDIILGNYDKAIKNFNKSLEVDPQYRGALKELGLAYLLNGEPDKALESMGLGVRKEPDGQTFYNLAYYHHLNGNKGQASKNFKKSQELEPDILRNNALFMKATPESSPTKKFFQNQLTTAKMYLRAEKIPAAIATEKQKPSLKITDLSLNPDPVPVNEPFDIHVKFKADIPGSAGNEITTVFYFKVLQNNKTLFTSESIPIKVNSGKINAWRQPMNPVSAKGVYILKAFVKYKELLTEKTIKLIIN